MCGIAGFAGVGSKDDARRMMNALVHRGPDGEGIYSSPRLSVHLAHRRLSILDLGGGAQPMSNEDGTIWVTFNGEIYNHLELRGLLEKKGHIFATANSDTEVLIHGWEEWGIDLPGKLNGMFAFCILDERRKQLFLARDRFGEKPLYWGSQNELFLFGSELSVFQHHPGFHVALNRSALKKYFAYAFIPAPHSAYERVFKLKQGNWLLYDLDSRDITIKPYYTFRIEVDDSPPSFEEAAEEVAALLRQAVARRLMSDVPLGVFLSGGIDSSSVAVMAAEVMGNQSLSTFSIGFKERSFDESEYARMMAKILACSHNEEVLSMDRAQRLIDTLLPKLDEPLGDGSLLPTYLLCRFTRQHVTVALSGDGSDELFAGYDPFKALRVGQIYQKCMPRVGHSAVKSLAELLPKSSSNMSFDFKLRSFLKGMDYGPELWTPIWMSPLQAADIQELFNEPVTVEELYEEALALWASVPEKSMVDQTLEYYTVFYLADDILTKVDRASMLNGLESRAVFLDNDLTEFVRKLPSSYKYDGKETKRVLKAAVGRLLPEKILHRPKKGFGSPLMAWLKTLPLSSQGCESFGMEQQSVDRYIRNHQYEGGDRRLFLWAWAVLQKNYMASTPIPSSLQG